MLVAMRPTDPRYASIQPGGDASVRGVIMLWPVINPLSRYRNAIRRSQEANPPQFSIGMKEKHDTYWHTEAEMAEGNPMLILERGEKVVMPPALWLQGRPDEVARLSRPRFELRRQRARAVRQQLPRRLRRHRDRLFQ